PPYHRRGILPRARSDHLLLALSAIEDSAADDLRDPSSDGNGDWRQRTIASPMRTTIPNSAAAIRKNSANRNIEMRRATTEMLVSPRAPAISEMMRKMMANLSMEISQ